MPVFRWHCSHLPKTKFLKHVDESGFTHGNTAFLTSSCSSWPVPRYNEAITTRLFAVLMRAWSEKRNKYNNESICECMWVSNIWYWEMIKCKQTVHFLPVTRKTKNFKMSAFSESKKNNFILQDLNKIMRRETKSCLLLIYLQKT